MSEAEKQHMNREVQLHLGPVGPVLLYFVDSDSQMQDGSAPLAPLREAACRKWSQRGDRERKDQRSQSSLRKQPIDGSS